MSAINDYVSHIQKAANDAISFVEA